MYKQINLFIFILLLLLIAPVYAASHNYHSLYGYDLLNVPTGVRFKFQNETGRSWSKVSKEERLQFLQKYEPVRLKTEEAEIRYLKSIEEKEQRLKDEKNKEKALRKSYLTTQRNRNKAARAKEKLLAFEKRERNKKIREWKKNRSKTLKNLRKL